jgi:hypothetical protein
MKGNKKGFQKTLAVRNSSKARILPYEFFETLVRLHRAGEGEPYTVLNRLVATWVRLSLQETRRLLTGNWSHSISF